jgi:5-methylcytosine-specific restriction enzyme subunit McrC
MQNKGTIQVFEFDKLKPDGLKFNDTDLKTLQLHYGDKGVPYYNLIHNGISFNNYVGVLQVNNITIEVLPKVDKLEANWKEVLINLLHYTGEIEVDSTEFSNLKMNKLSLLELYFSIFIKECNYLLHRGLVKKYRKQAGNLTALKGALQFNKNISYNLVHAERFYTKHTVYDTQHLLHQVLLEAMYVIQQVSNSSNINASINKLLLDFPEQHKLKVTANTFTQISYNRKSEPYAKAINIAKMILLNYHPDINKGSNNVLALFFDMNLLWEKYIAKVLRNYLPNYYNIKTQNKALFWTSKDVPDANIKPDIIIYNNEAVVCIIDTKWKLPYDYRPKDEDLKQMYSYNKLFDSTQSWLIYPSDKPIKKEGMFIEDSSSCGMLLVTPLVGGELRHEELQDVLLNELLFLYNKLL